MPITYNIHPTIKYGSIIMTLICWFMLISNCIFFPMQEPMQPSNLFSFEQNTIFYVRGTQFWQNKNAFFKLGNDIITAGRTFTVLYGSINWLSITARTVAHASNFNTKKVVVLNHPLNLNFDCTIISRNLSKRPSKQDPLECISTIFFKTHKLLFVQWKNAKIN